MVTDSIDDSFFDEVPEVAEASKSSSESSEHTSDAVIMNESHEKH